MNLTPFSGVVWRYTAIEQAPLDIERSLTNGGRFNPRLRFAMLYTSTSIHGAKAEFIRSAKLADQIPELLLPKMLHQIEVDLQKVIDLTDKQNRKFLGCSLEELIGDDWVLTQKIGTQLRSFCDAILSYSAADSKHKNLNLYIINSGSVAVVDSTKIQTMADWDHIKAEK